MASVNDSDWRARAVCEQFTTTLNLTEVESHKDPVNDPVRSEYKAREILREIYSALKNVEATRRRTGRRTARVSTETHRPACWQLWSISWASTTSRPKSCRPDRSIWGIA